MALLSLECCYYDQIALLAGGFTEKLTRDQDWLAVVVLFGQGRKRFTIGTNAHLLAALFLGAAAADANDHQVSLAGVQVTVVRASRNHDAFVLLHDQLIALLIEDRHLAFQDNEGMVLVEMSMNSVLAAFGVDLGMNPEILGLGYEVSDAPFL